MELSGFARNLWEKFILRGYNSLPPGFFGNLLEGITHCKMGTRPSVSASKLDSRILSMISSAEGFSLIEGSFAFFGPPVPHAGEGETPAPALPREGGAEKCHGERVPNGVPGPDGSLGPKRLEASIDRILDKIPALDHPDILFSPKDLEESFLERTSTDRFFPAEEMLNTVYRGAIAGLAQTPFRFTGMDLFEINHPDLFPSPAARFLFRKLMENFEGISANITLIPTLHEEDSSVASRFGEPQILPLGGYDSLTNRGDLCSLVPSELAFIEDGEPVDLFDQKFVENQLLYFKRDEGSVFRIRRKVTISLEISSFMEHERHMALLLAFSLALGNRILEIFAKDIVLVHIIFFGHLPSSTEQGLQFFRHFLRETGDEGRISLHFGKEDFEKVRFSSNYQCWTIGQLLDQDSKLIGLEFPQTDAFAAKPVGAQERALAELITRVIERMVELAYW